MKHNFQPIRDIVLKKMCQIVCCQHFLFKDASYLPKNFDMKQNFKQSKSQLGLKNLFGRQQIKVRL